MKTGIELIGEERQRQIEKEGWSENHDDEHTSMCLAVAGASYALDAAKNGDVHKSWKEDYETTARHIFPFGGEWFKPTPNDPKRQLVKAGALIAAEIDRLSRAEANES